MAATQKDAAAIEASKELTNAPKGEHYERMISGMLYDCMDPALMDGRFRARRFMHKYNNYFPDDATADSLTQEREAMLREQFGKIGKEPFIEPPLNIDYGSNIIIGDRFYSNFNLVILDCALVRIGDRVMFGPFVSIFAATHETEVQSRRDYIEYAREVSIGDDCWIGGNVTIMPGVKIGKGCTIGAGSVVTKDIPDFSVAVGSPAKVIKKVTPVEDLPKSA